MSKRGNDNQLTKDEYDRDQDDDSSAVMGTFKQASSDEMSRRVIKAPRGRKLGGATGEGAPKPSPFSGFSGFSAPAPSLSSGGMTFGATAASSSTATQSAAPTFSFGVTPVSTTATSQPPSTSGGFSFGSTPAASSATPSSAAPSFSFGITPKPDTNVSTSTATSTAPMFSFGGPTTSFGGFGKSTTTTTSPFTTSFNAKESVTKPAPSSPTISFAPKESVSKATTSTSLFSSATKDSASKPVASAPLFSFGSSTSSTSSNPFAIQKATKKDDASLIDDLNRDLNNDLTELNNKFSEKILKELKKNSHVNLAVLFTQYTSHRRQVKNHYLDLIESASINDSESEKADVTDQSSGSAPKLSFGLPLSEIKENEPAKPKFSGFNFGIDKPLTSASSTSSGAPAFGGFGKTGSAPFSFGAPATSSTSEAPKAPTPGAFSFTLPTAPKETSLFSTPATSSATTTTTSSSFTFTPKPFSFNPPASTPTTSAVTPAPFAGFSVPASQSVANNQAADNEKMPDDTKSELVDSREGEEGEETIFEVKAKLYAFQDGEHKDLGVGQFRINENTETKKRRMIMRTTGTGHLTLNSWVIQGMGPKREKNTVTIFGIENGKPKRFALRVKEEQSAIDVVKELEAAQTAN
ncbi:hypothetical protein EMPS_03705 [Entomortierella parvispora]|uniref:RanBD1 domain-containing protein n=1 Tax=Entomortierella parvispora TaxID=205924 RepID=A0A9P3H781_9FUNG|nr:hypothetical protein EMPS_03705 [Entomortierella parvispora]